MYGRQRGTLPQHNIAHSSDGWIAADIGEVIGWTGPAAFRKVGVDTVYIDL